MEKLLDKVKENCMTDKKLLFCVDRNYDLCDYEKYGFILKNVTNPNRTYVIGDKRVDMRDKKKTELNKLYGYDGAITKKQFYRQQEWYPIFDCGRNIYELNLKQE